MTFPKLAGSLLNSKFGKIAGAILGETPVGKVGRVAGKVADILGGGTDDELAEALKNATPDQLAKLKALDVELEQIEADERKAQESEITRRHAADMLSDSSLSKNVRPLVLGVSFAAAILYQFALLLLVFFGPDLAPDEVDTVTSVGGALHELASWAFAFYAGGRTIEKGASFVASKWKGGRA